MTLLQMANNVCRKMQQTDEESLDICKQFLRDRYQMIWDSNLWRDTLSVVSVSSSTDHPYLLMPSEVQYVISLRNSNNVALGGVDLFTLFHTGSQMWDTSAAPIGFTPVSDAVAVATSTGSNAAWYLTGYSNLEASTPGYVKLDVVAEDANGTVYEYTKLAIDDDEVNIATALFILSISVSFDTSYEVTQLQLSEPTAGANLQYTFKNPSNTTLLDNEAFKPVTNWEAERRCRVRLLQKPSSADTILALCKRRATQLNDDHHVPGISGIENALMACAQADMYERARQLGKARIKLQEASAHIDNMSARERQQSASNIRVVPQVEPTYYRGWDYSYPAGGKLDY